MDTSLANDLVYISRLNCLVVELSVLDLGTDSLVKSQGNFVGYEEGRIEKGECTHLGVWIFWSIHQKGANDEEREERPCKQLIIKTLNAYRMHRN